MLSGGLEPPPVRVGSEAFDVSSMDLFSEESSVSPEPAVIPQPGRATTSVARRTGATARQAVRSLLQVYRGLFATPTAERPRLRRGRGRGGRARLRGGPPRRRRPN